MQGILQSQRLNTLRRFDRWQITRFSLTATSFGLVIIFAFFILLTPLDTAWDILEFQGDRLPIIISTGLILLGAPYLYRWSGYIVDSIFYPDTAEFRETITKACQTLTEIDTRQELEDFLSKTLVEELQVDYIQLQKQIRREPLRNTLMLLLQMGERALGTLIIGPKCSGRSYNAAERRSSRQLQRQVSLVLSVIQLAEARQEADKMAAQKNVFLTNISNELRTPLNAVINLTGLVADEIMGPVEVEHKTYLSRAVSGSEYLMNLLDDILDMTKIETGQLNLNIEVIDLGEIINDTVSMTQAMLQGNLVKLKATVDNDLPPVMADRLRIRQILLNLLSNAAKFTKEGVILITATHKGSRVSISVQDTGIGIAPENLPLIFQDYQQIIHQGRNVKQIERKQLGTGLGLPITKALVELHGGKIKVESEENQGTKFTIDLPLTAKRKSESNGYKI